MADEFRVIVRGGDMDAMAALAGANMKAAGVPMSADGTQLSDEIWVVLTANDPEQARERVITQLPVEGGPSYQIERVDRIERTDS